MMLPKQVIYGGLAAAILLTICVCYLHFNEARGLVMAATSMRHHPQLDSNRARSSSLSVAELLMDPTDDDSEDTSITAVPVYRYMYTGNKTRSRTPVVDVSSLEENNFLLQNKMDVSTLRTALNKQTSVERATPATRPPAIWKPMANASSVKEDSAKSCQPLTHIVFFKMHKCSSSTVQNILFRFGEEHQLNFVLPPSGNYLGHAAFNKGYMINFPAKEYNILCHHTIFSAKGMAEVMPSSSVYVTILRDPVPMFESLFSYNNMAGVYHLPRSQGIEFFLNQPDYYYRKNDGGILHIRNPMLYGLGLPKVVLGDEAAIDKKIEQARKQFDLVMMTEYFEESLILLRELMCWETDDVVYFVINARTKAMVQALSPQVTRKIRKWNHGDVKLYDAFNRTFWEKVKAFGSDRMKQEVAKLRERNQYFRQRCIAKVTNTNARMWHPPGISVDSFQLKPEASEDTMCVRMTEPELHYTAHIREIQKERFQMT